MFMYEYLMTSKMDEIEERIRKLDDEIEECVKMVEHLRIETIDVKNELTIIKNETTRIGNKLKKI